MLKLYDSPRSGNCYKVRLLIAQLSLPIDLVRVDHLQQETQLPEFLQINPTGKVPVLELEPGVFLSESNAILLYLSEGTPLLPDARLERLRVMEWLFFEQYSLGPNLSRPRFWMHITKQAERFAPIIEYHQRLGNSALSVMEQHLSQHSFFVGERYTIADIALYAYTHVADQGGYQIARFPAIQTWIERVQAQPNYIELPD